MKNLTGEMMKPIYQLTHEQLVKLTENIDKVPEEYNILKRIPVPEGVTIMASDLADDETEEWYDTQDSPYAYVLAQVEFKNVLGMIGEGIFPYSLTCDEVIFKHYAIVNLRKCPKCGKYMKPQMKRPGAEEVSYFCPCGERIKPWAVERWGYGEN